MATPENTITEARARELVAAERARITAALADLEAGVRSEGPLQGQQTGESWELGTDLAREGVDLALVASLRGQLIAADRAAARIDAGTYGRSVESGRPIPTERLEAMPLADRTMEEQVALELWEAGGFS
jgi:DnaK suppressor protein